MAFTNPIWLWGLSALAAPLAIHLLSRKESKVIRFGSLRHLVESTTNQSITIRMNEWWLLVLRCLLIFTTVALLSGLNFGESLSMGENILLIERGVNQNRFSALIDSLKAKGYIVKELSADNALESGRQLRPDYWTIANDMSAKGNTVVLSRNSIDGFKGKRIAKPDNITWLTAPVDSGQFNLIIVPQQDDSVFIRKVSVNDYATSFKTELDKDHALRDSVAEGISKPTTVLIVSDDDHSYDNRIITAALKAIQKNSILPLEYKSIHFEEYSNMETPTWLVWLSSDALPRNVASNIITASDEGFSNAPLLIPCVECKIKREAWKLTRPLDIQSALTQNLTHQLGGILLEQPKQVIHQITTSNDRRAMPEEMLWSKAVAHQSRQDHANNENDLAGTLALLILSLLAGERFLAMKRNQ